MLISLDGWKDDCSEKEYDGDIEKEMTATAEEQELHHDAAEDLWTQCSGGVHLVCCGLLIAWALFALLIKAAS